MPAPRLQRVFVMAGKRQRSEYYKKWRAENKDKVIRDHREYLKSHKEEHKEKNRIYNAANPDKVKAWNKKYEISPKGKETKRLQLERNASRRAECVYWYSNGLMRCECCGEKTYAFLTIDHIDGGGCKHRKKLKTAHIFRWILKNNFPTGFRVLCHNCNSSFGYYGYCPHQFKNVVVDSKEKSDTSCCGDCQTYA